MSLLELVLLSAVVAAAVLAWGYRTRLARERARREADVAAEGARRRAELAAQEGRTAALFDRMVEGILVLGPEGRLRFSNRAAGALFDFVPPAAGRTILEATRHHEVAALAARLEREPEVLNHELRIEALAGARHFQVNALALRAANGSSDGAILVFHDLTRLRQLEGVRQEFVANVSHELRTPLSLIRSAAETLVDGGKDDPVVTARFLNIIERQANRLTLLIDDLLLLARLDSGRVELDLTEVPLREAVREALDDAALVARARSVVLENTVPAEAVAWADPARLRQVLTNLIDNAIKYGREAGRVMVGGMVLERGRVELWVRDDGPGIPAEARARIFERFYRVDKARSREQGGTGLGLAIVKNVVQAHGGDIDVDSAPGQGTTFRITLPAAKAPADQ